MTLKAVPVVIITVTVILLALIIMLMNRNGVFRAVKPACACRCDILRGIPGPEDLVIDHGTGLAYISSIDRRATLRGENPRGAVFIYDIGKELPARNVTPPLDFDFHPHGISLYAPPGGEKLLFVINHRRSGNYVEIFALRGPALVHRESITNHLFTSPNDLAAAGPRTFYVTIDHRFTAGPMRYIEELLGLPLSTIVYYDGREARIVATGLAYANSVALSPDGVFVYATETMGRCFNAYRRDAATGTLALESTLALGMGADNIDIDETGTIWVAGHPNVLRFILHVTSAESTAPSLAGTVTRNPGGLWRFTAVYADDGRQYSASSVAARHGGRFLVGGVFNDGFLRCRLMEGNSHD